MKRSLRPKYIRDGRAPIPTNEITSRIMSSIRAKNTKPELIFIKGLRKAKLSPFRRHDKRLPGRPDITFPGKKLAIFINGCYWHRCPHCKPSTPKSHIQFWRKKFMANVLRDKKKSNELKKLGWKVMVIWECQLRTSLAMRLQKVGRLLGKRLPVDLR